MCNQTLRSEDADGAGNAVSQTKMGADKENSVPQTYFQGRAKGGHPITDTHRPALQQDKPLLIGIRGKWYDVTEYLPHHPGGDVLLEFSGRDATAQFLAYHDAKRVLKYRKHVGTYDFNEDAPGGEPMQGDWLKLYDKYEELGYNKTPTSFIISRFAIIFAFLIVSLTLVWYYLRSPHPLILLMASISLAGFWQQSGFLMHDAMHSIVFHDTKLDYGAGWFLGNVFLGVSGKWWRDEHTEHHLFTNTLIDGVGSTDPQMVEDVWVQDIMLAPRAYNKLPKVLQKVVSSYQHLYFVPILAFVGPYVIKGVSIARERRPWEVFGTLLYYVWIIALLRLFPSWQEALFFYWVAMLGLGVLSVQLLVSHYSKDWVEKEALKGEGSWAKQQVEAVVDIDCPLWLDWFYGGLHLHSPHHLFPRMSRYYYRAVHQDIAAMCTKNGMTLDVQGWVSAVTASIEHLRHVGLQLQAANNKLA